jgi:hypothetical protein
VSDKELSAAFPRPVQVFAFGWLKTVLYGLAETIAAAMAWAAAGWVVLLANFADPFWPLESYVAFEGGRMRACWTNSKWVR